MLQIRRWQLEGQHQLVVLLDHPSQLTAADTLFALVYNVADALSTVPQDVFIQTLQLADQLQVQGVTKSIQDTLIDADTDLSSPCLSAIAALPSSCWARAAFVPILPNAIHAMLFSANNAMQAAATQILLEVWGDLESVWTSQDPLRRDNIWLLSVTAFHALLSLDGLSVVSEDTVLHTITQWISETADHGYEITREDIQQLADGIRFSQLSSTCRTIVAAKLKWLSGEYPGWNSQNERRTPSPFITQHQLMLAGLAQQRPAAAGPIRQAYSALPAGWLAGPRIGVLTVNNIQVQTVIEVAALQKYIASAKQSGNGLHERFDIAATATAFAGCHWLLQCVLTKVEADSSTEGCTSAAFEGHGIHLGLYVSCYYMDSGVDESFKIPSVLWDSKHVTIRHGDFCFESDGVIDGVKHLAGGIGQGCADFFGLGVLKGWDAAGWAAKGLPVEGNLTIEWTVSS